MHKNQDRIEPSRPEVYAQVLGSELVEIFGLTGEALEKQRRPLLAVARRVAGYPGNRRQSVRAEVCAIARVVMQSADRLDNPCAVWQARVDEQFPREGVDTVAPRTHRNTAPVDSTGVPCTPGPGKPKEGV